MRASLDISVLVCALLAGCTSTVQVGLANAPVLGGETPETRVHDVIANGHDACERSAFPPGEVLRGQVPPCGTKERVARIPAFMPPPSARISPWRPLGVCRGAGPGFVRTEQRLAAISLPSSGRLVCGALW